MARLLSVALAAALAACAENPAAPTPGGGGGSCTYTVADAPTAAIVAAGAEFTIAVTTAAGCAWTATSSSPFVTVVGIAAGTGPGSVRFAVQANTGAARQGSILVAGQTLAVNQVAGTPETCDFGVSPTDVNIGQAGGDVSVNVTINNGTNCAWSVAVNDGFITSQSGGGSGAGTVGLNVAANSGGARSGTATVAGRTVTIQQEGVPAPACAFTVSPTQLVVPAAFSSTPIAITVTQGTNCAWTAQSQSSFVLIGAGGSSGVGSGSINLGVGDNGGSARTGTALVAGHTVTVNQVAGPSGSPIAVLRLQSEPGDFVGGGQSRTLTFSSSQFSTDASSPAFRFQTGAGAPEFWQATFAPPAGQMLVPGLYTRAYRWPFQDMSQPGLSVTGNSRGCNQATGRFLVSQAVFSGNVAQRFHVKFQQHCEGWSSSLRGELWIDAQGSPTPPPMPDLPAPPPSPSTIFSYQSDAGDWVGQGQSVSHTLADLKFSAWHSTSQQSVHIRAESPTGGVFWSLEMKAPSGTQLTPGTYLNATRFAFNTPGTPGLDVHGNGRGCNTLTGQFTVVEASYGPKGEIFRFRATFEQHCEGVVPAMRGEIYIVADPWK